MKAHIVKLEDKLFAACSYMFFVPALFIALTDKRKFTYEATHAAQAILLWIAIAASYIIIRIVYSLLSGFWYFIVYDLIVKSAHFALWIFAVYCGLKAYREEEVAIPYISDLAKKIL